MKVYLDTAAKRHYSEAQWKEIHRAIKLFLDVYNMRHLEGSVKIDMNASLPWFNYGRCVFYRSDPTRHVVHVKRGWTIPFKEVIHTLFHELVHVYQDMVGKVRSIDKDTVMWNGTDRVVLLDGMLGVKQYYNLPWEVHAREQSRILLKRFNAEKRKC